MKAKLALKVAAAVFGAKRNKESHSFIAIIIIVILLPVILIILFASIIIYLISHPYSSAGNLFGEQYDLESFQSCVDTIQSSAFGNYDYNAVEYKESTITQGNKSITYYNQLDTPWRNMLYGKNATIGKSGCGPTSMAIVISTLLEEKTTPAELADWSYINGYLVTSYDEDGEPDYSTSHALIPAAAKAYGLSCTGAAKNENTEKIIKEALSDGKMVVAIMGAGQFTKAGHFIVLTGISEGGRIYVTDCASRARTNKKWQLSVIIDEAKDGAGAGGPFWIIE